MTAPQQALLMAGSAAAVTDPSFSLVAWLSHCDAKVSVALTCVVGSATVSLPLSATAAFGANSVDFTGGVDTVFQGGGGVNGWATGSTFGPTTNDFMFEGWCYTTSASVLQGLFAIGSNSSSTKQFIYIASNGSLRYLFNGSDRITSSASLVTINTWHFWQLQRIGTATVLGWDGVQVGSTYTDSNNYPAAATWFGHSNVPGDGSSIRGYIDETRLTVGTGRTINLPTSPFPDS